MVRALSEREVEFVLECHPEDEDYHGNCSAIDEKTDRRAERWIERQLDRGNEWAWCRVVVRAQWNGFEGWDSLGCCSYRSEQDFRNGGYFEDMRRAALANLNETIAATAQKIDALS